ncbi:proton-conducting transporter membrane subunit [Muricoccus radiodurans]|uniref:proton-conducting transporter transmembrane domain-containing protein n=1 Tax=Muricoccus radiodurans TaxID=2231721 RepID=UPI003CF63BEF
MLWLLPLLPLLAAGALGALANARMAALGNIAASGLGLLLVLLALVLVPRGEPGLLALDGLNAALLLLGAVVGLTTATYSAATFHAEGFTPVAARAYHAAFQAFLGAHHLALLADNLGLMWVAIEVATLATVLMVAVHRTPAAIGAAWKFFILCGTGIALALFGTIVLAMAGQPHLPDHAARLSLAALGGIAAAADGGLLSLAFVLLLVGYGTKAGLAPLHSWLPDAHAEGPTAISAVLSGLLLNVALHAVLRVANVVGRNAAAVSPGPFLVALGLLSLLIAAFSLWRRRDARRLLGWSSIEHMGLAALAFGLGAPVAGVLHMAGHSLIKGAAFFAVGAASILKGGQEVARIGGLAGSHPVLGWGLALALAGLAGLPPFPFFATEIGMALAAAGAAPWLLVPLAIGLVVAAAALVGAIGALCLGPATPDAPAPPGVPVIGPSGVLGPLWLHLLLALAIGLGLGNGMLADAAAVLRP